MLYQKTKKDKIILQKWDKILCTKVKKKILETYEKIAYQQRSFQQEIRE